MREQLRIMENQDPLLLPTSIAGPDASPVEGGSTRAHRAQRGLICNIASVLGFAGIADNAAYVSSKHALLGLVKASAIEYGAMVIRT